MSNGYDINIKKLESIHVYPMGAGSEEHNASMDCFCEPTTDIEIEHPSRPGRPVRIINHGAGDIAIIPVMEKNSNG